jgi:hypothetical protein
MTEFPFKLGALPPDPAKPRLMLAPHRDASFGVPGSVDYHSAVHGAWGMYWNNQIGDCTFAEVAHQIISSATYARGHTGLPWDLVRGRDVLKGYSDVAGYDQYTGANDNGCQIQDVLNYWRKTGVGKHRNVAFTQVKHTDMNEVQHALYVFGSLDLGMQFPQSAHDQFARGLPWDAVPFDGGIIGGHSVELVGYDANYLYVVTWGRVVRMTYAFWNQYITEAWAVILPEWLNVKGADPLGVDLYGLESDLYELTGVRTPLLTRHLDFAAAGLTDGRV